MERSVLYTRHAPKVLSRRPGEEMTTRVGNWPRWSLGIRTANFIFVAGTGGVDPTGNVIAAHDPKAQVEHALDRLTAVLEGGGAEPSDVFFVRAFLDGPDSLEPTLAAIGDYCRRNLAGAFPAISTVVATSAGGLIRAEIELFAATSHESIRSSRVHAGLSSATTLVEHAHAVRVGNLWFLSGQLPLDLTGNLVGATASEQTRQALDNLRTVLEDCGREAGDLIKLTTWIGHPDDAAEIRAELGHFLRETFSGGDYPATTTLIAPIGQSTARVQVQAVATSGRRIVVETDKAYRNLPDAMPYSQAIKVAIESEVGSYLRRFTWPTYPPNVDRGLIGGHLEVLHPLGNLVFISSQAGLRSDGQVVDGGMGAQSEQVLDNMRAIAVAAGGQFRDIVQFDVFFADSALYPLYNDARIAFLEANNPDKAWFAGSGPRALSCLNGALIEIESIAAVD
jgi:2-iminobutanoate/2-iminopropanoate deaminase